MRLNRILLFSAALACAWILMASRATKSASACFTKSLTAKCNTANPSYVSFDGCYYDNCSNGGTVWIYNGCNSNCTSCGTHVATVTTGNNYFCGSGFMTGSYNVNCASPNQGYVCAYDWGSGTWTSQGVDIGYCDCTSAPTSAPAR